MNELRISCTDISNKGSRLYTGKADIIADLHIKRILECMYIITLVKYDQSSTSLHPRAHNRVMTVILIPALQHLRIGQVLPVTNTPIKPSSLRIIN